MAVAFVQFSAAEFTSAHTSFSVSFSSGVSAGSIIVVAGMFDHTTSTTANFTDGKGDSFTNSSFGFLDNATIGTRSFIGAFFAPSSGAITIVASYNGTSPTFGDIGLWEFSGLTNPSFDKVVNASGTGTAADSGTTGTLSSSNEAAVGYGNSAASYSTTATGGWTVDFVGPVVADIFEHQVTITTSARNGTANLTGTTNWEMWAATFMSVTTSSFTWLEMSKDNALPPSLFMREARAHD